jgi:protein O-mannosyl-transferase
MPQLRATSRRPIALTEPTHWWRQDWVFAVFLLILSAIAYFPALNGTPIWDDDAHITRPELQSWDGLAKIWTQPGSTQQYYPFVHSVFWVEHNLWGDAPIGYHLVNLFLHCISAFLLLRILRRLEIPGSWLAAAIFALHPVQVESVAWISELKNTLSGVFYLSSGLIYLEYDRTRKAGPYVAAVALFLLGLLSKTVIATLPAALLVIFWWKRGKLSFKRDALPLLPVFILGIAAASFTAWVERTLIGAEGSAYDFSFVERVLIAGRVVWFYLGKLFWPLELIFIYPRWQMSQSIWWQYLFPVTLAVTLAILVWFSRRRRAPLAGMLFFIGTLVPVLGFLNVYPFRYSLVADHFQYLALLGVLVPVSAGIALLLKHLRSWQRSIGYTLCVLLLIALALLTHFQSGIYRDIETLWLTTIRKNPTAWMAHNNLGAFFLKKGQLDDAIGHFTQAIEIKPDEASVLDNLGSALLQKGNLDEAIVLYQKALELKPTQASIHYNLANALLARGEVDHAVAEYEATLAINPNHTDAQNNLGAVLFQQGNLEQAIDHYQKALEINSKDIRAEANLAWALATSPQSALRKTLSVKLAADANQATGGINPRILRILAAAYAQNGDFSEAVEIGQRAMKLATEQNNFKLADTLRSELDLYQNNQPCLYGK